MDTISSSQETLPPLDGEEYKLLVELNREGMNTLTSQETPPFCRDPYDAPCEENMVAIVNLTEMQETEIPDNNIDGSEGDKGWNSLKEQTLDMFHVVPGNSELSVQNVFMAQPSPVTYQPPETAENQQKNIFVNDSSSMVMLCQPVIGCNETVETCPTSASQSPTEYDTSGQEYTDELDCQNQLTTGCMPSTKDYPGDYNFEVQFNSTFEKHKSWSYSSDLNKLYICMDRLCPISFRVSCKQPNVLRVRALPVFSEAEFIKKPVKRCLLHSEGQNATNKDFQWPHHLIRCDHQEAIYEEDPNSSRLSVVVPLEHLQSGSDTVCRMFKFMCRSSCVGGPNRRPVNVIFTLETIEGRVVGRHVVSVRICSCPNRDQRLEEEKEKNTGKEEEEVKRVAKVDENRTKKRKLPKEENLYFVPIHGRKNYELLKKMAERLEMAEKFELESPAETQELRVKRSKIEKQLHE